MVTFLIDEDLPRSLAHVLTSAGFPAHHVRDVGLAGRPDTEIAAYAAANGYGIITRDVGFAAAFHLAKQPFAGVLVVRYPDAVRMSAVVEAVGVAIRSLVGMTLADSIVVIEPGRLRVRRTQ